MATRKNTPTPTETAQEPAHALQDTTAADDATSTAISYIVDAVDNLEICSAALSKSSCSLARAVGKRIGLDGIENDLDVAREMLAMALGRHVSPTGERTATPTGADQDEHESVWSILDGTGEPLYKARSLISILKLAWLNGHSVVDPDNAASSLNVLADLLVDIAAVIGHAQLVAHGREIGAPLEAQS